MSEESVHILIIEDNPVNALHLEGMLAGEDSAFTHQLAGCLADGIERLRADMFDLVLLDLNLPDNSGLGTLCMVNS